MMSLSYSTMQCYYVVCCSRLYAADEDSSTSWCVYTDCLCNKFKSIQIRIFCTTNHLKMATNRGRNM
jgi:hypothetical protein